jgi:hypothetical protein
MDTRHPASFRDPSGFMFSYKDQLYRQVQPIYKPHYDHLMASGLYADLTGTGLLIPHTEIVPAKVKAKGAYKVLQPQRIPLISYPFEWSFSQLREAALCTLEVHKRALQHGMILKDASAYNVQFSGWRPTLIDTLSFEIYEEGTPWVAYRQFCQHFLAPLALIAHVDVRLGLLLRDFIDGIPLDLAAQLLPRRTLLNLDLSLHIHAHAAAGKQAQANTAESARSARQQRLSKQGMLALVEGLTLAVRNLKWQPAGSRWADYYQGDSYTGQGFEHKQILVEEYLAQTKAKSLIDLGANTGLYSRIASQMGMLTVSADSDPGAVEINYQNVVKEKTPDLLPIVIDLTNPSPALGWANRERAAFADRFSAEAGLALALIHHLAISNNVPLADVADLFAGLAGWFIVEFVPKEDPKVQALLAHREDIFTAYTVEGFESAFTQRFKIIRSDAIQDSGRRLYLLKRKER